MTERLHITAPIKCSTIRKINNKVSNVIFIEFTIIGVLSWVYFFTGRIFPPSQNFSIETLILFMAWILFGMIWLMIISCAIIDYYVIPNIPIIDCIKDKEEKKDG